jgi:DNA-binding transcriptional LysR family regulator
MEWSDLEVFLAAVRTGTYTAAGRQLKVNRTTIGRRVEALERALGTPLFEYSALGPAPTAAGARLLAAAEAVEREISAMLRDLGTPAPRQPTLRIAGSAGLAAEFLPEIADFRRANPDVPVELLGELDPLDAVTQRRADLAIALVRAPPLRLAGAQVGTLRQAAYGRRGAGALPPLGWGFEFGAAIPGGPWAGANPSGDAAQDAGLVTCNDWPQLKQAVLAGLGRAALWCFAADAEPELERLAEPDPRHDSPLWLLHRAKAPPGPGLARLIDHLRLALPARIGNPGAGGGEEKP